MKMFELPDASLLAGSKVNCMKDEQCGVSTDYLSSEGTKGGRYVFTLPLFVIRISQQVECIHFYF